MDEETFDDGLASLRAQIDQAIAVSGEQARAAHGIYTAYTAAGFSEEQAFAVVMENVRNWLQA